VGGTITRRPVPLLALLLACGAPSAGAPPPGTPAEERFWATIEQARAHSVGCSGLARAVTGLLSAEPATGILEFRTELERRMAESYRWDLWAVAYVANGGASDDGFEYFRAWLIGRGRARYTAALQDPPSAVQGAAPLGMLECEDLLIAPYDAYEQVTGVEPPPSEVRYPAHPLGQPWTEDSLRSIYPTLVPRVKRWRWLFALGM
jgi:hypothetical protein